MTAPSVPFLTVGTGGLDPDKDVEDGTYPMTLIELDDPKLIFTTQNPSKIDPTTGEEIGGTHIIVWRFALDDYDDRLCEGATSTATGPKSKAFEWLTALLGREPVKGEPFTRDQLIGRGCLGRVVHNSAGYPKVASLTPTPKAPPSRRAATPAPAATPDPEPAPATTAADEDDLGF